MIKPCNSCRFSLKWDQFNLESALYCFNPNSSHIGGYWTNCADARHIEYGMCGPEAKNFKSKKDGKP